MTRFALLLALAVGLLAAAVATHDAGTSDAAPAPRPARYLVLTLLDPERIAVVDLADGRVAQRRLASGTLCWSPLLVVGEQILYMSPGRRGGRVMSVDLRLRRRPRWVADADVVVPSASPGRVWLGVQGPGRHGRWLVRELTVASGRSTLARVTAPSLPILGAVSGGLVLGGAHDVFVWSPRTGRRSRATPGPFLLAAQGSLIASCGGRCSNILLADGTRGRVVHAPRGTRYLGARAAISPDGALAAVPLAPGRRPRLALVDVAAGGSRLLPGVRLGLYAALAWAPSQDELYLAGSKGRIRAYAPGMGRFKPVVARFEDTIMQLLVAE